MGAPKRKVNHITVAGHGDVRHATYRTAVDKLPITHYQSVGNAQKARIFDH